ncbi:hypothetical protein [Acinetobacter sp. UBA6526]|uniref:hypothetical protein n=1 Tax=Acinetobacter sp. UBA6526 TaxID=1945950 RepID=UPI00257CC781|nr:hypothetical protein [Acinetobacter sp. UBA6526]|tara:strand:+ start:326 stop:751 length:426 start_codon:yes stop_codon:yes gene_type:complete
MASILNVDTISGKTTAGSISITGEGNSTTTNLQQGLCKAWADIAAGGASLPDSFNFSSIDDDGTGEYGLNFTNAMGSINYSANATVTFNHAAGSNNVRVFVVESKATSSVEIDSGYTSSSGVYEVLDITTNASVSVAGDLA